MSTGEHAGDAPEPSPMDEVDDSFFDRSGTPISLRRWCELVENHKYKVVRITETSRYRVSTVWLGVDTMGLNPPVIFETLVTYFDKALQDNPVHMSINRYVTEAGAIAGHESAVAEAERVTSPAVN